MPQPARHPEPTPSQNRLTDFAHQRDPVTLRCCRPAKGQRAVRWRQSACTNIPRLSMHELGIDTVTKCLNLPGRRHSAHR